MDDFSFEIKTAEFEGPFDLLLLFIEREELDIHAISLSKITNDFLAYIQKMQAMNMEVASEFIFVAATLMRIKAKTLIPKPSVDEEGNDIDLQEDLIQKLNQDIANHKYKEYIQYFSFIEDVREHLNMTDILLVPSLMADPFPTTILEGLSAGKPVIATNGGWAVQSIEDGVSGRLINRDTPNQFRDILTILITDETERRRLGANARERFLNMFQVNIFKENIRKVFDSQ